MLKTRQTNGRLTRKTNCAKAAFSKQSGSAATMENETKKKWLPALFFSLSGIIFGTSLYLIATSTTAATAQTPATVASAVEALPYPDEPRVTMTLERDIRQRLGKLDIIYRGVKNRNLRLDVYILDLDPQYAYRRTIALSQASEGFRVGGVRLELLSARDSRAKIIWNRKG
jgi:hypothetical protein